jgi:WD40 repeat protein
VLVSREVDPDAMIVWRWMPDSSALLVAMYSPADDDRTRTGDTLQSVFAMSVTGVADFPLPPMADSVRALAWSADGRLLTVATEPDREDRAFLSDAADSTELDTAIAAAEVLMPLPGGRVVGADDGGLTVWDAREGSRLRHRALAGRVAWIEPAPNGSHLAVCTEDATVAILGPDLDRIVEGPGGTDNVAWSPDSRWIASCAPEYEISAMEIASGMILGFAVDDRLRDLAWCPGRELLAVAGRAGVYFLSVTRPS